jgi:hypothetical protein
MLNKNVASDSVPLYVEWPSLVCLLYLGNIRYPLEFLLLDNRVNRIDHLSYLTAVHSH